MSSRIKELGRQLGMPHGTAVYRLLRLIIYRFAVETGKDSCYRCGGKINRDEFSIEHKEPWLHISSELFWNENNIAFSHQRCNYKAARQINKSKPALRKTGPNGTSWCNKHKGFLPVNEFGSNKRIWNGLQNQCKACRRLRNKRS